MSGNDYVDLQQQLELEAEAYEQHLLNADMNALLAAEDVLQEDFLAHEKELRDAERLQEEILAADRAQEARIREMEATKRKLPFDSDAVVGDMTDAIDGKTAASSTGHTEGEGEGGGESGGSKDAATGVSSLLLSQEEAATAKRSMGPLYGKRPRPSPHNEFSSPPSSSSSSSSASTSSSSSSSSSSTMSRMSGAPITPVSSSQRASGNAPGSAIAAFSSSSSSPSSSSSSSLTSLFARPPQEGTFYLPQLSSSTAHVTSRPPATGDFMSVTSSTGKRCFAALETETAASARRAQTSAKQKVKAQGKFSNFLGKSLRELLKEIEADNNRRELADMARASAESLLQQQQQQQQLDGKTRQKERLDAMYSNLSPEDNEMWVTKYAPHSYTDLLSSESCNREVLKWMKSWDVRVFGPKSARESQETSGKSHNFVNPKFQHGFSAEDGSSNDHHHHHHHHHHQQSSSSSSNKNRHLMRSDEYDDIQALAQIGTGKHPSSSSSSSSSLAMPYSKYAVDNRISKGTKGMAAFTEAEKQLMYGPEDKVILLSGPPGAGKTTLAHIIARHCGYRVLEVNASDDRNAETLSAKIRSATQTRSLIGSSKPNCLVIDEIDGAMGGEDEGSSRGAINVLVDIIKRAKAKSKALASGSNNNDDDVDDAEGDDDHDDDGSPENRSGSSSGKSGRRGAKNKANDTSNDELRRPIICICNDQFAPALRPLLPHVKIIQVEPVTKPRLVERLKTICKREMLSVDSRLLSALVDLAECDIRSCLHTLQLGRAKMAGQHIHLTVAHLKQMSIGQKDMAKSSFALWESVLSTRVQKGALDVTDKGMSVCLSVCHDVTFECHVWMS